MACMFSAGENLDKWRLIKSSGESYISHFKAPVCPKNVSLFSSYLTVNTFCINYKDQTSYCGFWK